MKKKHIKKLMLNKKVVAKLNHHDAKEVKGGGIKVKPTSRNGGCVSPLCMTIDIC